MEYGMTINLSNTQLQEQLQVKRFDLEVHSA